MRGEMAMSGEMPTPKSVPMIASRKTVTAKMATGEVMAEMPAAEMAKVVSGEMTEVPAAEVSEMVTAEMASAVAEVASAEMAATEMSSFGRGGCAQRIEGDQRNAGDDRQAHCAKHFMAPM
jgi:hypothetical protein